MIVYALFLTEEAKGKQERMCAVAQNFFQEFGDVRPRYLIGFMSETFDLGLAESSIRTIWYDKCGMYDQLRPVLQEFFRNLYRK